MLRPPRGRQGRLAVVLARQKPAWEPGTRQAYHALSLGFSEGELLRRVDPAHRSLGQFLNLEVPSGGGVGTQVGRLRHQPLGTALTGDPRDLALRPALDAIV